METCSGCRRWATVLSRFWVCLKQVQFIAAVCCVIRFFFPHELILAKLYITEAVLQVFFGENKVFTKTYRLNIKIYSTKTSSEWRQAAAACIARRELFWTHRNWCWLSSSILLVTEWLPCWPCGLAVPLKYTLNILGCFFVLGQAFCVADKFFSSNSGKLISPHLPENVTATESHRATVGLIWVCS